MAILSYYVDDMLCCPNCGAEACITEEPFNDGDIWYRPECSCCNISWSENYPTIEEAVKAWNESRTVESRPVVHARWIKKQRWGMGKWHKWLECSECGYQDHDGEVYEAMPFISPGNYCSDCGATMDLESEGKDE